MEFKKERIKTVNRVVGPLKYTMEATNWLRFVFKINIIRKAISKIESITVSVHTKVSVKIVDLSAIILQNPNNQNIKFVNITEYI